MTTIKAACLVCAFLYFSLAAGGPAARERARYEVPKSFDAEPGNLLDAFSDSVTIDAREFSLMLSQYVLAANVSGFQPNLHGVSHDTMVIVRTFDPADEEANNPPDWVIENWDDFWNGTGNYKTFCLLDGKDELTGYYRYHQYCDPEPHPNASFFLLDRVPNEGRPRPPTQEYVRGLCKKRKNFVRPEDGAYHQCSFRRLTPWGDGFSFNLYSDNVRLHNEVEEFIVSLLESWKTN